ncbi:MAG: hypothetical protein ACREA0_30345, partial [bacterium]
MPEGDLEGASIVQWLRVTDPREEDPSPIDGATDRTYTLVAADEGELISFEVTPVAQSGTLALFSFTSDEVGPITAPPNAPPEASAVRITGTPQVGQVLTG